MCAIVCVRVCVRVCVCVRAFVWRTAGDDALGEPAHERMEEDLPTTDQPYVDPLQELRVDMRRLLGQLEGRKVPLSQVNAEWKRLIDPEFDLKKYQMRKGKRQQRGLRQLLQCIPDTVNIVTALGPYARTVVEWAVLIDVAAS